VENCITDVELNPNPITGFNPLLNPNPIPYLYVAFHIPHSARDCELLNWLSLMTFAGAHHCDLELALSQTATSSYALSTSVLDTNPLSLYSAAVLGPQWVSSRVSQGPQQVSQGTQWVS